MKVNELQVAKIALQMGYKSIETDVQGEHRIVREVLDDFISENQFNPVSDTDFYGVPSLFIETNKNIITRSIVQPITVLLSEQSCLGKGHLNETLIKRLDVLTTLIDAQDFSLFIEYLILNNSLNRNFNQAKILIEKWLKEDSPVDYISLLEGRLFNEDYEEYFSECLLADSYLSRSLKDAENEITFSEAKYGGYGIRMLTQLPEGKELQLKSLINLNKNESKIAAWQLTLIGYVQTSDFTFEFSTENKQLSVAN